jgi:hypothetical protein
MEKILMALRASSDHDQRAEKNLDFASRASGVRIVVAQRANGIDSRHR